MSGPVIYAIRNWTNGKKYVGSAVNAWRRKGDHENLLRRGKSHSCILQHAWDKYGEISFVFEIIERPTLETLITREQFHLDQRPEYNVSLIAGPKTRLGMKSTPEHRANQSRALKGRLSPMKGKHFSEEHKRNLGRSISKARKGVPLKESHKKNIGLSLKGKTKGVPRHPLGQTWKDNIGKATRDWWITASPEEKKSRLAPVLVYARSRKGSHNPKSNRRVKQGVTK